jgi:hypothetical protein
MRKRRVWNRLHLFVQLDRPVEVALDERPRSDDPSRLMCPTGETLQRPFATHDSQSRIDDFSRNRRTEPALQRFEPIQRLDHQLMGFVGPVGRIEDVRVSVERRQDRLCVLQATCDFEALEDSTYALAARLRARAAARRSPTRPSDRRNRGGRRPPGANPRTRVRVDAGLRGSRGTASMQFGQRIGQA